jgi:HEAT repeat protein
MITNRHTSAGCIRALSLAALAIALAAGMTLAAETSAVRPPMDGSWDALPSYRHGDDLAPLLAIEREAIDAMRTPELRAALAARLGAMLGRPDATAAARQWVCLLLRQVGTPAELPILARHLSDSDPDVADAARQAIESIPGPAAVEVLRGFLPRAQGRMRLGVIAALGRRRDAAAASALAPLVAGADQPVANAAARAIGLIADPVSLTTVKSLAERSGVPTPQPLQEPLLRFAEAAATAGDRDGARAIREFLSRQGQPASLRQAALRGLLESTADAQMTMLLEWLAGADADRRCVAAALVGTLDDSALDTALEMLDRLEPQVQQAIITVACRRIPNSALPVLIRLATTATDDVRVTAIECLGRIGAGEGVPVLLDVLTAGGTGKAASPTQTAAWNALAAMPRKLVGPGLVHQVATDPAPRADVLALLAEVREPTAWEPLARLAVAQDPAPWQAAIDSLGRLARPDAADLERLVELYGATSDRQRREAVARMIATVCRQADGNDAARTVIAATDRRGVAAELTLPLIGRLGGSAALTTIESGLTSPDPLVREAAFEGLCNWPDAAVAERVLAIARECLPQAERQATGRLALRAYVRMTSLKSERSEESTLAMLQEAMALAADCPAEDRGFILERTAAAVRTMDAVEWIARYLDDPSTSQAACRAIVALAHHKPLRRPNLGTFAPLLDRVASVSNDPAVATRATRYRLGL